MNLRTRSKLNHDMVASHALEVLALNALTNFLPMFFPARRESITCLDVASILATSYQYIRLYTPGANNTFKTSTVKFGEFFQTSLYNHDFGKDIETTLKMSDLFVKPFPTLRVADNPRGTRRASVFNTYASPGLLMFDVMLNAEIYLCIEYRPDNQGPGLFSCFKITENYQDFIDYIKALKGHDSLSKDEDVLSDLRSILRIDFQDPELLQGNFDKLEEIYSYAPFTVNVAYHRALMAYMNNIQPYTRIL